MKALVIIDMLKDFVYEDGALPVPNALELVPHINQKIKEFRANKEPVIFVCDSHDENDKEFEVWPKHCVEGTEGAEVIDELDKRDEDIVVKKKRFSAFYGTELDRTLKEKNIDTLVLTGVLSNICVLHTAADAVMRDYRVIVCKECVKSVDEETNKWALKHLKEVLGAEIK